MDDEFEKPRDVGLKGPLGYGAFAFDSHERLIRVLGRQE